MHSGNTLEGIVNFFGILSVMDIVIKILKHIILKTWIIDYFEELSKTMIRIYKNIREYVTEYNCTYDPQLILPIQMDGIERIKIFDLIVRLKKIANNKNMRHCDYENFIDNIPLSSNYWINITMVRETMIGNVHKILKYHHKSIQSIRRHIELYNLTDECEIGLSKKQMGRLWELEHWNIYG